MTLSFYFRIKSFEAKKKLVAATFMSVLDYGDVIYIHTSSQSLHAIDTVYHGANLKTLTHHCELDGLLCPSVG